MQKNNIGKIIAIVGPHYSGKSTLAKKMAQDSGFISLEENWKEDPFTQFRENGDYLKSQVWYLTETMQAMLSAQKLKESGKNVVLDTFMYTTRAFCRSKLTTTDFEVFNVVFSAMTKNFPLPDLIIYLHADSETLLKHSVIRTNLKTGPSSDKETNVEWINKTIHANEVEFGNWSQTPIITVDISKQDLVSNTADYGKLLKEINKYA